MCAVDWALVAKDAVNVGDEVSADAGGMPIYRVVALADGLTWLQDDQHASLRQAPLDHFPWRAAAVRA